MNLGRIFCAVVCTAGIGFTQAAAPAGAATNGVIAFEFTGGSGQTIKTVNPESQAQEESAGQAAPALSSGPLAVPGVPRNQDAANPAWSPSGTLLAYSSTRGPRSAYPGPSGLAAGGGPAGGRTDIYVVNANAANNGFATLPLRVTDDPVAAIDPTWSPDGLQIAFTSMRNGHADIYVVDLLSRVVVRLTSAPSADHQADWSPDGSQIAFQSDRAGTEDIWLMARDGSNQRALTSGRDEESDAEWKPDDGARIAYSSGVAGEDTRDIYSIRATGGGSDRLTRSSSARNAFPAWSPDGKEIAYAENNRRLYVMPARGATAASPARELANFATEPDWAILPVPMATASGDVTIKRPRSAAQPVSGATTLPTGTVVDTTGGGELTVTVNRPAVSASTPDSVATIEDAVVRVTERTPESLELRIQRPDCSASGQVMAARSKPKKARVRTRTRGKKNKKKKKAQVKPSSAEGHMSSSDTDYEVVVTCNGTYVRVRDGIVFVTPNGKPAVRLRAGRRLFLPRAR